MTLMPSDESAQPFQRVVDWVVEQVRLERLTPHDKLPPTRQLAQEQGVAVNTAARALAELRLRGVIYSHQGRGSFISDSAADVVADQATQALKRLDVLEERVAELEARLEELKTPGTTG